MESQADDCVVQHLIGGFCVFLLLQISSISAEHRTSLIRRDVEIFFSCAQASFSIASLTHSEADVAVHNHSFSRYALYVKKGEGNEQEEENFSIFSRLNLLLTRLFPSTRC